MSAIYRYPGVKPFEISDAALFFGRERDQSDLLDLVKREKLAVLFGKSGYGKSSLVKAGLLPKLIAETNTIVDPTSGEEQTVPNCPVYIRLNLYGKTDKANMPVDIVLERYRAQAGEADSNAELAQFFQENKIAPSLWTALKSSKTAAEQRIFLIFDQFEEFFSYPIEAQVHFRQQLSELLYTRIPQTVRDQMGEIDRAAKRLLHKQLDVHALFIIRSDRMHLLNGMREELPAILHTRYELNALNQLQAKEAIVEPARLQDPAFILQKPFEYEPAALDKILSELSKSSGSPFDQDEQLSIEAFQLQMVCLTVEQNLLAQTQKSKNGKQPTIVKEGDLPDFGQIYEQYYTGKIAELPDPESRKTAHILLEEVLVIGEGISDIRRVSMDKDLLEETIQRDHQLALTQDLLNYLEDKFLIRRETLAGRVHYEVSHDVLLAPLLKSRDEARQKAAQARAEAEAKAQQIAAEKRAKEAEQKAKMERERREAEQRQAEAEQKRLEAEQRRVEAEQRRLVAERLKRRARFLAAVALIGFVFAAATGIWAFGQKEIAVQALTKQRAAELEKEKQAFYLTISDIEIILKSPDGCPDGIQIENLNRFPPLYPDDSLLQKRVNNLRALIKEKNCQ